MIPNLWRLKVHPVFIQLRRPTPPPLVLNRAAGRHQIFDHSRDHEAFLRCLEEARSIRNIRILAYCMMPNHWHQLPAARSKPTA